MTWNEAFARLAAVRDEMEAARYSLARVQRAIRSGDPMAGESRAVRPAHIRQSALNLEITYLSRLFAEFEGILRDYGEPRAAARGRAALQWKSS